MSARERFLTFIRSRLGRRTGYERFREDRFRQRRRLYRTNQIPGLLSFLTTVWNTDVKYLQVLAESVRRQAGGTHFEWLVLDNGSTSRETTDFLASLSAYPFVRLHRVEENLGIVGGMRYCLERASGTYILPLDSDDYIYPDCVNVLTWHIKHYGFPALLYTDEDKIRDGRHVDPYFKPAWDPVLFVNSCYIAHLCGIDRKLALELGVYSDEGAEGCHDWDTFTRFMLSGLEPHHVPEVLYSWRIHPQSTAGNIDSKHYIHNSHEVVLNKFIIAQSVPDLYALELSPLFNGTPDRWFRRKPVNARPVFAVLFHSNTGRAETAAVNAGFDAALPVTAPLGQLKDVATAAAADGALVHLRWDKTHPDAADWRWEAIGLMELFPDTVMVGGRMISRDGKMITGGSYFGFGRGCDSPDHMRAVSDPGYFAQMWKQHSVSSVSAQHAVVDSRFLLEFIEEHRHAHVSFPYLGAWLGAYARRRRKRVVYTPFMSATCDADWDDLVSEEERCALVMLYEDLMPDPLLLSPHLGLTPETAYQAVDSTVRERQKADLLTRARRGKE